MAKLVKEISAGHVYSRSSEDGALATSQTRVFKILLTNAGEVVNFPVLCGVSIGDAHPVNTELYCVSYDFKFEGDSRMVGVATFNYRSTPSDGGLPDPKSYTPEVRPALISTSTSLIEVPAHTWREFGVANWESPNNPVGDKYEGITKFEPIVTINIEQWDSQPPLYRIEHAGKVNSTSTNIYGLNCFVRSVMFRGLQSRPAVEHYNNVTYKGYWTTYEFAYRANWAGTYYGNIGWDRLQPITGFNVKAFAPGGAGGDDDPYGQPLKHKDYKIQTDPALALPDNIAAGDRVRAMVKVFDYKGGGASQCPSAQPVPLNKNGRPRAESADPKVLVERYQVYQEYNFSLWALRVDY
jgi:hypothetical protein